jgi:hypothetical protein
VAEAAAAAPSEDSECCALVVLLLLLLLMVPKKVDGDVAAVCQGRPDLLLAAFALLLVSAATFGAEFLRPLRQGYPVLQGKTEGTDEGGSRWITNKATHSVRVFRTGPGRRSCHKSQDGPTEAPMEMPSRKRIVCFISLGLLSHLVFGMVALAGAGQAGQAATGCVVRRWSGSINVMSRYWPVTKFFLLFAR